MLKHGDICPVCGQGHVEEKVINGRFKYKGKECVISDYHIFACGICKEELVCPESLNKSEKILTDFRRQVDGLLISDEIKAIRKRLGKTQKTLAEMLNVGEKTFARYENGQVTQSKSMDTLLRALNIYPDLLDSIKSGGKTGNDYDYTIIEVATVSTLELDKYDITYPSVRFDDEQVDAANDTYAAIAA